ncbi:hypothetical protein J2S30_002742 [Herbaspirillum rubrisubalbicans]|nr:hypothetical protein [Herbaspirillum rubrisubalbicans]
MVAVRRRTAGQPALRRKIFSDGPGMNMPGAAACARRLCACSSAWRRVVSPLSAAELGNILHSRHTRFSLLSLPIRRPHLFLHQAARCLHTSLMRTASLPSFFSYRLVSGMDIADRNVVTAVAPSAWFSSRDEGFCALPDRAAYAYNAPAESCVWVMCQHPVHCGGGLRKHRQARIKQCWQRCVLAHRIGGTAENNNRLVIRPASPIPGAAQADPGQGIRGI